MWARLQKQKIRDYKIYKISDKRQIRGVNIEFDFYLFLVLLCLFVCFLNLL